MTLIKQVNVNVSKSEQPREQTSPSINKYICHKNWLALIDIHAELGQPS